MNSKRCIVTIFFAVLTLHLSLSASVPYKKYDSGNSVCPGGKPTDVLILLDVSKHLSKEQFDVQIQRAEHMVRLFRNFGIHNNKYNRISILTFSEKGFRTIVKLKRNKTGSKYTDELAHILRNLHNNREYDNTIPSRNITEILALKQILRLSYKMRTSVAHVAFYFSADHSVSEIDLKRARKIKKRGIYLYILRLGGASRITFDEYKEMVSPPVTDFVFDVKEHSKIDSSVKKLLNMEHCNMQVFPPDDEPKPICKAKRPVNFYLGVERNSLGTSDTLTIIRFYKSLKRELKRTNGKMIQSQLIFNDISYKKENISQSYINILKQTMEAAINNTNQDSQKTLLLFIKSNDPLTPEMINEATVLKDHKVEVYVAVEGKTKTDFAKIVSKPAQDHLFSVPYFKKVKGHKDTILKSICNGW